MQERLPSQNEGWDEIYWTAKTAIARIHATSSPVAPRRKKTTKVGTLVVFRGFHVESLVSGGLDGDRTCDTRIFNPLLYQLSYRAETKIVAPSAVGFLPIVNFECSHR